MAKVARILLLALGLFFAFGLLAAVCIVPSCKTTSQALTNIEAMDEVQFTRITEHIDALAHDVTLDLYASGKASAESIEKVAHAIDDVANDPLSLGGSGVLTEALKRAGIDVPGMRTAVLLIEDYMSAHFVWGSTNEALGPHARLILFGLASAIRSAAKTDER